MSLTRSMISVWGGGTRLTIGLFSLSLTTCHWPGRWHGDGNQYVSGWWDGEGYITCEVTPFTYHRPGWWHVQQAKCVPSLSCDYHPALTDLTHFAIISHSHSTTYGCIHQRLPHSILRQPLPTLVLRHLCVLIPQTYLAPRASISCKSFFFCPFTTAILNINNRKMENTR